MVKITVYTCIFRPQLSENQPPLARAAHTCTCTEPIERFHSCDYRPYWFTETKEFIYIKIEFISQRFSLGHQHGRHSFVLGHQHGRHSFALGHQHGHRGIRHEKTLYIVNRELKQRRWQRQQQRRKTIGLMSKSNHSVRAFYIWLTFLCRPLQNNNVKYHI